MKYRLFLRFWVGGISLAFLMGCALIREDDRPQRADRIFGMLMGSAVADALAGPHEGRSTEASQTFLEEGGWVDAFDTPYSRWYQSHWNVYEQGASPGTYTDDSRLRLFVAESMLDFRGEGVMDQLFLAEQIFHKYRQSRTRFVDADKDVLKECFLDMWFWWELTKLATSVRIPETELLSPPARREELLDENEEPTGYWKLVDREAQPLDKNLKAEWHDGSYQEGKEWPIGQITLLPLATYFPGESDKAFQYLLGMNFLDIGNAPVYPAFISALLADGLGGREWDSVRKNLLGGGLVDNLDDQGAYTVEILKPQVVEALQLSDRFQRRDDYPSRTNYIDFVKALHETFAVGTGYKMCTCEEMLSVPLAIADYSMKLGLQTAVENGVNYGRYNDTVASFVATLVGAYRGMDDLRPEWIALVQNQNPSVDIAELSEKLSLLSPRIR